MAYVVSLEGYTPPARYDGNHWTQARVEEGSAADGPWSPLSTHTLSPVDGDPTAPAARNFTDTTSTEVGWYRVVWLDGAGNQAESSPAYFDQSSYQSSGVNFGTLISRLSGLTAITPTEAKARLNQAHRELVVDAEALTQRITIGPTIVGESVYELDPDVVKLKSLRVNGLRYDLKSIDELDDLANDPAVYSVGYPQRYFAQEFSTAGSGELTIWPIPVLAGQVISGRAAMRPPDLVNDSDFPSLPAEYHEKLVDPGAFAVVLSRDDERFADAQAKSQEWEQLKHKLYGQLNRRIGSGPARVKLVR